MSPDQSGKGIKEEEHERSMSSIPELVPNPALDAQVKAEEDSTTGCRHPSCLSSSQRVTGIQGPAPRTETTREKVSWFSHPCTDINGTHVIHCLVFSLREGDTYLRSASDEFHSCRLRDLRRDLVKKISDFTDCLSAGKPWVESLLKDVLDWTPSRSTGPDIDPWAKGVWGLHRIIEGDPDTRLSVLKRRDDIYPPLRAYCKEANNSMEWGLGDREDCETYYSPSGGSV